MDRRKKAFVRKNLKNKRKRKIKRIFFRFFILFLFIFLIVFAIKNSPLFTIREINIIGNHNISVEEIKKKASVEIGNKYFQKSKKDRVEKIKSIAYVKNAKIKYYPNGKLNINITERKPFFQVKSDGYYLIDEDLRVLKKNRAMTENLVNIEGIYLDENSISKFLFTDKEDANKVELLKKLNGKKYNIVSSLSSIELLDSIATFKTIDNIKIEFGSYNNIDYKIRMLRLILDDIKRTDKDAVSIEMEKGDNPILIERDTNKTISEENKNEQDDSEKEYKSITKEEINNN